MNDWAAGDMAAWELFIVEHPFPENDDDGVLIPDTLWEVEAPF